LIDSNAAKVLVPGAEWRGYTRERARLLREISEEMGQLPSRNPQEAAPVHNPLMDASEIAQDENGNWFIIK
jgi:hypothetical protein